MEEYYHNKLIEKNISLPSFEAGFEPKPILLHPQQSHEYTFYLNNYKNKYIFY